MLPHLSRFSLLLLILFLLLLSSCQGRASIPSVDATMTPLPIVPTPSPTAAPSPGAGFRFSTYGPAYDPGPQYWAHVGQEIAARFPGAVPEAIWIVGTLATPGSILTFPGYVDNLLIHFSPKDRNEEFLTLFDQLGGRVWLQVEPADAPVDQLFRLILERYSSHPSVVGVGVDVEWYHSSDEPGGVAVTDEEAATWLSVAREYNPSYRLFLKHWEQAMLPPTLRDGLLFVDDSQIFDSLDQMTAEFEAWGKTFAPAPVAFQFGYPSDQKWWGQYDDPVKTLGQAILDKVPNTQALFWVDFTILQVIKP